MRLLLPKICYLMDSCCTLAEGKKPRPTDAPAPLTQPHSRAPACMPNFVYLLQSTSSPAKTYIGVTNDIARRLRQHNGEIVGGARYTRRFRPWKFLALFAMRSRREALQLEWRAKHTSRRVGERGPAGRAVLIARVAERFPGTRRVV